MENIKVHDMSGFTSARNILIGIVIGGLAGAVTMLLVAPQSGKRTRLQIQQKGIELSNQATRKVKKAFAQVRSKTNDITASVREKAGDLIHSGQDQVVKQLDRVTAAVEAA
jgi:gas vesicle protein